MGYFDVVLSKTDLPLWKNEIPDFIFTKIISHSPELNKTNIMNLPRDNLLVLETLIDFYGKNLEMCDFASLVRLPRIVYNFYRIIQIPIYGNGLDKERIQIHAQECVDFHKHEDVPTLIYRKTFTCDLSIMFKGFIWDSRIIDF